LLKNGADPNIKNEYGKTPIDVARDEVTKSHIQEAINRRIMLARTGLEKGLRTVQDGPEREVPLPPDIVKIIIGEAFPEEIERRKIAPHAIAPFASERRTA
jgi:hypothetical protein